MRSLGWGNPPAEFGHQVYWGASDATGYQKVFKLVSDASIPLHISKYPEFYDNIFDCCLFCFFLKSNILFKGLIDHMTKKLLAYFFNLPVMASLVVALLVAAPTQAVSAATLTVCPDGTCAYTSIQTAINAATPGDTILVGNGTYNDDLVINKALTLQGENQATVIIDVPLAGSYGIYINASDVFLEGFTLQNGPTYGIKSAAGSNFTLRNVTVKDTGRSGVDLNGVNDGVIENVTVSGAKSGVGIALSDSNRVTVRNVHTSANLWGGVAIYTYGRYYTGGSDGVSIEGNNTFEESNQVYIEVGNYDDPAHPYAVTNFSLVGDFYRVRNSLLPFANYSYYQLGYERAYAYAQTLIDTTKSSIWHTATQEFIVQSPLTINAAIAAANPGDLISIYAGIFNENVLLNKRLRLVGSGSGNNPAEDTILRKAANSAVMTVSASGLASDDENTVLIQDIRIEPVGVYGLNLASLAYLHLNNVQVVGSSATAFGESEACLKIATTADVSHLTVENSAFNQCDYGWYVAKHGDWGPAGSNFRYVNVENTEFANNDFKGLYIEKLADASFTDVVVIDNGSQDFWNMAFNGGMDINLKGEENYQNLSFNNMTVSGNGLGYQEGAGLMIKARDDGATYGVHPASLEHVTITGGIYSGNERGIRIGEPGKTNAGPSDVVIRLAQISNNIQTYSGTDGSFYGGVVNHSQQVVDARGNWWGADSGPFHTTLNPLGLGDTVSDRVLFDPWMRNAAIWAQGESYEIAEDEALVVSAPGLLANDLSSSTAALTAVNFSTPASGNLSANPDGSFSYQPADDFFGQDSFTYQVSDGTHLSEDVLVEIEVRAVNDVPVALADTYQVDEDTLLSVSAADGVLANDSDAENDSLTAVLLDGFDVAHGTLTLLADGSFSYQPAAGFVGIDSFRYYAYDGSAQSQSVTVQISVLPGIPVSGEYYLYLPIIYR